MAALIRRAARDPDEIPALARLVLMVQGLLNPDQHARLHTERALQLARDALQRAQQVGQRAPVVQ